MRGCVGRAAAAALTRVPAFPAARCIVVNPAASSAACIPCIRRFCPPALPTAGVMIHPAAAATTAGAGMPRPGIPRRIVVHPALGLAVMPVAVLRRFLLPVRVLRRRVAVPAAACLLVWLIALPLLMILVAVIFLAMHLLRAVCGTVAGVLPSPLLLSSIRSFLLPALPGCAAAAPAAAKIIGQAGHLPLSASAGDNLFCIPLVRLGVIGCLPANIMSQCQQ